MFGRRAFQWWYGWRAGVRRIAGRSPVLRSPVLRSPVLRSPVLRGLLQCLLACALIASARSAQALEEPDAPLCDLDAVASHSPIECERPVPAPVAPPDAGEAPMCDETGASIAARIVIPELDRGRLEALPCELVFALFGGKALNLPHAAARWGNHRPPAEPIQLTLARADAALARPLLVPERAEPCALPAPLPKGLGACPGHLRPPYRPPLSG